MFLTIFGTASVTFADLLLVDTQSLPHVFNAFSKDDGNKQFAITLDSTEFKSTDPIGFTLVFQETALPNSKPPNGSIEINIDNGTWQSLVSLDDTNTFYHKTIAPITTAGVHTLFFKAPNMCNSAFNFSFFGIAFFGTTDCLFSMPVTIVQNNPPTTPLIAGDCVLGEPCSLGIVSTDTDGGQLCYDVKWPNGTEENIGCAIEGTSLTTVYTFNSCAATATTVERTSD